MTIRTYFWEDRIISRAEFRLRKLLPGDPYRYFLVGNAGDILSRQLIERRYGQQVHNVASGGKRLLMVGSIGHRIQPGDLLCGIGVKTREIPSAREAPVQIWGLRGPVSREVFQKAGHDVSEAKFFLDPGLLIRFQMTDALESIRPSGAIFVPHYRERAKYIERLPKGIRFVDIDAAPEAVAREIIGAELVYASSLHGVIFAHALHRPCVLVRPQTVEPMLKYEDYYASVGLALPKPLDDIWQANLASAPSSPADVSYGEDDFVFPSIELLRKAGIAAE